MPSSALATPPERTASRPSAIAGSLVGSEILKIAADVRALAADGRDICNLTVGDFSPTEFRIPQRLEQGIVDALRRGETNYPAFSRCARRCARSTGASSASLPTSPR